MSRKGARKATGELPTKDEVRRFIQESPGRVGKRELARAFNLDASQRPDLRRMLKELREEGSIESGGRRHYGRPGHLPETVVLEITGTDTDGELLARPVQWKQHAPPPTVYVKPDRLVPALGEGNRVLCRTKALDAATYEAQVLRRLETSPDKVLGVFEKTDDRGDVTGRVRPTDRRAKTTYMVSKGDHGEARDGDLVQVEVLPGARLGPRHARVVDRLGNIDDPRAVSFIALQTHDVPIDFPDAAVRQAEEAEAAPTEGRADLRDTPLVTIDGEDAKDFDDAVFAEPDGDGWHLIVAIADVAWYVRPGDALDKAAYERGNSVYLPDRVVPMLPEALSNGWCSLRPDEDRPCMAAHLWLDGRGGIKHHRFERAVMRSHARLTYTRVQNARDGVFDDGTKALEQAIANLFAANEALEAARDRRGALELDLPEPDIRVDETGNVTDIHMRPRYEAHRVIENFMIAANVAAAETLERLHQPCMYRVHDSPAEDKVEELREFLDSLDIGLPGGSIQQPSQFNRIIRQAENAGYVNMVQEVILRSQAQACYSPENIGHFGLGLNRYAHFTSPIRRYADLLVHRALIRGLNAGRGGLSGDAPEWFQEAAEHISATERRAAQAERDANDRFTALFLADKEGGLFDGRINGATHFGLFITLEDTGASGLIPIATLPRDYYDHDATHHCLVGRDRGLVFRLGDPVQVRLKEAEPTTGGLLLELVEAPLAEREPPGGEKPARKPGGRPGRDKPPHKKKGAGKGAAKGKSKPQGKAEATPADQAKKAEKNKGAARTRKATKARKSSPPGKKKKGTRGAPGGERV